MGTKLQIVLCVLLLSNLGSAILGEDPAAPPSPTAEAHDLGEPGVPLPSSEHPPSSSSPESAGSDSLPGQDSTSLAAALAPEGSNTNTSSSNDNSSIAIVTTNNNTAMEVDGASVTPLVQHPPTASPLDSQEDHRGNGTPLTPPPGTPRHTRPRSYPIVPRLPLSRAPSPIPPPDRSPMPSPPRLLLTWTLEIPVPRPPAQPPMTSHQVTPPPRPRPTPPPSQLNVGGDATVEHQAPTLDPLLAGLVSAFIVTAVIITLLLFLKLRRRDNRPQFHRLQDLPMDDMMEDTPLSMYSY